MEEVSYGTHHRRFFCLISMLFFSMMVFAQPKTHTPVPDPSNSYGEGTTITLTESDPVNGVTVKTVEFKDKAGVVRREIKESINDLNGKRTVTDTYLKPSGRKDSVITSNSSKTETGQYRLEKKKYEYYEGDNLIKSKTREEVIGVNGTLVPVTTEHSCVPRITLYGGPGAIQGEYGEDKKWFVGGEFAALYHFKDKGKWAIMIDASFYGTKEDESKLSRSFLLGGVQYQFFEHGTPHLLRPFVYALGGMGMDHFKMSGMYTSEDKETGFTWAAGGGTEIPLSKKFGLRASVDYLNVKWAETNYGHVRVGAGAYIKMGCF